jgi:glycosyltransferase involved in cell wall biosynthesis
MKGKVNQVDVQLLFLKHFVGKRNTDYRYSFDLAALEQVYPLKFHMLEAFMPTIVGNMKYALGSILFRIPIFRTLCYSEFWAEYRRTLRLPKSVLKCVDVIYTNHFFPLQTTDKPVVLEADFFAYGCTAADREKIARLLYIPSWMIRRSKFVIVRHELSLKTFRSLYPDFSEKGVVIPAHYMPYLEPIPELSLSAKFRKRDPVKFIFVGNDAIRKGLSELVQAYEVLPTNIKKRIEITVISNFNDGFVKIPGEFKVLSGLPRSDVLMLMQQAHVFAMPTKRDAFGKAFIEALASGCAIICPDTSPQKELFGPFGVTVDPKSPNAIAYGMQRMVDDWDYCELCAFKAWNTFLEKYHHSVIGEQYWDIFQRAVLE